ncbi:MAG TPA: ABC transporter permease [Acidimicrobiia bacterium]|nr:ABC transporter permease [Acidimicrobiia bacterium]
MASPDTHHATDPVVEMVSLDDIDEHVTRRRRFDIPFTLAVLWFGMVVFVAIFADLLPIIAPTALDGTAGRAGPSAAHWLGADGLGRDMLSRIIYGARTSLTVGVVATFLSGFIGLVIGLLAGYFRGFSETLSMGAMDILLSFPALVLAIALAAVLGTGTGNVIIAIAILALPAFARIARAETLAYADREFVKAARSLGAKHTRILLHEISPNILPTVVAFAFVIVAVAIVVEASLSFLGLGVPPDVPTWGGMISHGRSVLDAHPHISMFPATVLFLTVLALNTIGDKLRHRDDLRGGIQA